MSNTTNETSYEVDELGHYPKLTAYFVIIVLSLVGNTLVIAVIYKNANQHMRTPSNYFVVSMAVGDGLIAIINMVSQVVILYYGYAFPFHGVLGIIFCKIKNFMWMFLISWSTGSLSAIAVDRFFLVFVPYRRIITLKLARVIIGAIITVGAAISSPYLFVSTVFVYGDFKYCGINMTNVHSWQVYTLFLFSVFIFFPLVILFALYSAIALKLWLRKTPGNPDNRSRMNRRIFPLLITIVILFTLCWAPVASLYFGCTIKPTIHNISCRFLTHPHIHFWLWFVAYSNSAINPYIYFIFNENFQRGAKSLCASVYCNQTGLCPRSNQVDVTLELQSGIQETS